MNFSSVMVFVVVVAFASSPSVEGADDNPCVSLVKENIAQDHSGRPGGGKSFYVPGVTSFGPDAVLSATGKCCTELSKVAGIGATKVEVTDPTTGVPHILFDFKPESGNKAAQRLCDALNVPVRVDLEKNYVEYEFDTIVKECGLDRELMFNATTCAKPTN